MKTIKNSKKVGRNDLCGCGSGKKFKRCCLNKKQRTIEQINKSKRDYSPSMKESEMKMEILGFDFFFEEQTTDKIISVLQNILYDEFQSSSELSVTSTTRNDKKVIRLTYMFPKNISYKSISDYLDSVIFKMMSLNEYFHSRNYIFRGYLGWEVYNNMSLETTSKITRELDRRFKSN